MMPLFIDLEDKQIVIFGGGNVGYRKAKRFIEEGCNKIIVASISFLKDFEKLTKTGKIKLVKRDLTEGFLDLLEQTFMIVPVTDNEKINEEIKNAAIKRGILVNHRSGDVFLPSIVHKDKIVIAISTQGLSPALSRFLRIKIEEVIDERYDIMADILSNIRKILIEHVKDQDMREKILADILSDKALWNLSNKDDAINIVLEYIKDVEE